MPSNQNRCHLEKFWSQNHEKKEFEINFFVQQNASKFATFIEKENPHFFKAFYLDKKLTSNLIFLKSVTSVLFSIDRNAILLEFALLSHSTKTSLLWCFTASWSPKKNIRFISSCCCPFKMWKENLENVLLAPVLQVYRHELSIY